jgi:hypothetical protein
MIVGPNEHIVNTEKNMISTAHNIAWSDKDSGFSSSNTWSLSGSPGGN